MGRRAFSEEQGWTQLSVSADNSHRKGMTLRSGWQYHRSIPRNTKLLVYDINNVSFVLKEQYCCSKNNKNQVFFVQKRKKKEGRGREEKEEGKRENFVISGG